MIEKLNVTKTIDVPGDKVWAAISGIGGLDRWFPVIASCRVEGEGVGAIRVLGLGDGGEIRDRIEEIDHQTRRFRYVRTDSPFPVTKYLGTVDVRDADGDKSEVSWTVEIDVAADARDELTRFLKSALSAGISGIEQDLR
ncbi:SRPBCC family protein [Methylocaldum sp.]|uniref:SRPBCC family protein n=1 Tax=Methylocaldum sp. TaxID=1969727 RepID=UPI002D397CBF|nr:SRPBCC family protein [Methylocaldum sp.]HYE36459.1 SRPBCC family protein [Methylocaldum sp.]